MKEVFRVAVFISRDGYLAAVVIQCCCVSRFRGGWDVVMYCGVYGLLML